MSQEGRLAQLVEHWSNKPRVAGSSPVVTIFFLRPERTLLQQLHVLKHFKGHADGETDRVVSYRV